jgi:PAS domain S-box-containing protein
MKVLLMVNGTPHPRELLFEHAPEVLMAMNTQGHLTEFNKKAELFFGRNKTECLGQSFHQNFLASHSQKIFNAEIEKILSSFSGAIHNYHMELIGLNQNGLEFPIELIITPIKVDAEFVLYAVIRDLSETKKQAIDLKTANLFLNAVIENIPDMIFLKEATELRFTRFNKAGQDLLGFTQDDLMGKNDFDIFPKDEAEFFTSIDRNVLNSKSLIDIAEEPIQTKFKGPRILHTKKVPLYGENGQPAYLLGISEDITDKKQAEETRKKLWQEQQARLEAEKALQLRDDFISIAAHELRTPLTTLSLQIQLLTKFLPFVDAAHSEKFSKMMTSSQDQVNRFEKLVDDLLDVSRASAGMLILEKSKENLSDIVNQVVKSLETRLTKANCPIELNLTSEVIGHWDKSRLEQVMTNLISNAFKYGAGHPIEIKTSIENGKAILVVRDHGIGISPEDQERVFNRFERAVSVKKYGGLGLGLYIAHQIITAHAGQIRIQSELGQGSTFTVELPL